MIHTAVSRTNPSKRDGKYVTSEFIPVVKHFIINELCSIHLEHSHKFGDMIICLDNSVGGYWRKDVYSEYKSNRKKGREESEVDFKEVFAEINVLLSQLELNVPWKVISVERAEADDIMLHLAKKYNEFENILIHSPDKDMIQAQRDTDRVFQYSSLTKKWLTADTKSGSMTTWIQEHCILGDASDNVPKVVDHTEFSDAFVNHLKTFNIDCSCPSEFKSLNIEHEIKVNAITSFGVWKLNRKGESTGIKDIYKNQRFGPSTLKKKIKEFGTVEQWLNSHPMFLEHYKRNYTLVMEEGIPDYIRYLIDENFKNASIVYRESEFTEYLSNNGLSSMLIDVQSLFRKNENISAENCGW